MAYIQAKTPSPNTVYDFSLRDFSGGLNNASDMLKDSESSNLLNMVFVDEVLMEKRLGQTYYDDLVIYDNTVPIPLVDDITFIDEYKPYASANVLLRASDLKLYAGSTKIANVVGKISGINHYGKYYFADGGNLYVYGIMPQTTSIYEVVTGTPVATPVVMKVVSPAADYVQLDATHTQGVTRYNYTTLQVCYEPCKNEFDDTYKGANVVPDDVKYILSHNGRLFISGSDKDNDNVYITPIQRPFYFAVSLPMQLPPNSDKVIGMRVYNDCVVVGRQDDIYSISGITNNPELSSDVFKLKRLNTHTGFASNSAIDVVHNYLFFLGSDGNCYSLSSTVYDTNNLITTVISKQLDIIKTPISVTLADCATASSVFFDDEWYLSIKDKVLIYSYKNKAWTMWNNFNARSFYNLDYVLIWGNTVGRTVKFSTGNLDFDLPFQAYWYSKRFDMNNAVLYKYFRDFFIVAHTYDNVNSDINIVFEIDYSDTSDIIQIANKISIWGKTLWGERFINRNIVDSLPILIGRRGRNLRFKFSNGYFTQTTIATVADLENVLGKEEGSLVYVTAVDKYYLYTERAWVEMADEDLDQKMKIYQVNGEYELRGRR